MFVLLFSYVRTYSIVLSVGIFLWEHLFFSRFSRRRTTEMKKETLLLRYDTVMRNHLHLFLCVRVCNLFSFCWFFLFVSFSHLYYYYYYYCLLTSKRKETRWKWHHIGSFPIHSLDSMKMAGIACICINIYTVDPGTKINMINRT